MWHSLVWHRSVTGAGPQVENLCHTGLGGMAHACVAMLATDADMLSRVWQVVPPKAGSPATTFSRPLFPAYALPPDTLDQALRGEL